MESPLPTSVQPVEQLPATVPVVEDLPEIVDINHDSSTRPQDRTAGSSSPSPSTSSSSATVDSATAKSTTTSKTTSSSTSTLARISAIAKATTKLHFISTLIPSSLGPKHAAALIHIQAAPPVMAIEFKPLVLTPINFSLTDGTNIPAPLSPPLTPVDDKKDSDLKNLDLDKEMRSKKVENGLPTPVSTSMESPRKQSGIRKFLSLRLGGQSRPNRSLPSKASTRPGTALSADSAAISTESPMVHSLKHRRSMGWFVSRRKSNAVLEVPQSPEKMGPPPPTIPELHKVDEDMHAEDLFKDIK